MNLSHFYQSLDFDGVNSGVSLTPRRRHQPFHGLSQVSGRKVGVAKGSLQFGVAHKLGDGPDRDSRHDEPGRERVSHLNPA
jgi:hypothetical protein